MEAISERKANSPASLQLIKSSSDMLHRSSREKTHPHPACCTLPSFLTGSPSTSARAHFQLLRSHSPGTGQSLGPVSL